VNHGDIVWADLPDRGGREQRGRRPVIIWQDVAQFPTPTLLVIPLTSQLNALTLPATLPIPPTVANGLTAQSVALVFQLGACDVRRLGGQLGCLDSADLLAVLALAKRLQKIP
jgi:mRNA-degrading endonuclease toxin of MazEF toxin-antitoxin module